VRNFKTKPKSASAYYPIAGAALLIIMDEKITNKPKRKQKTEERKTLKKTPKESIPSMPYALTRNPKNKRSRKSSSSFYTANQPM